MNTLRQKISAMLVIFLLFSPLANAHLMPAQRGTLNIMDGAVFMVLSLPVSAFRALGVDENGDGLYSPREVNAHLNAILGAIRQNVILSDSLGKAELVGLMLSSGQSHIDSSGAMTQLTVLGRFNTMDIASALRFEVRLYGPNPGEQSLAISAIRKSDQRKASFELTPAMPVGAISFNSYTF